jgi:predicted metal-dependent RNase
MAMIWPCNIAETWAEFPTMQQLALRTHQKPLSAVEAAGLVTHYGTMQDVGRSCTLNTTDHRSKVPTGCIKGAGCCVPWAVK